MLGHVMLRLITLQAIFHLTLMLFWTFDAWRNLLLEMSHLLLVLYISNSLHPLDLEISRGSILFGFHSNYIESEARKETIRSDSHNSFLNLTLITKSMDLKETVKWLDIRSALSLGFAKHYLLVVSYADDIYARLLMIPLTIVLWNTIDN